MELANLILLIVIILMNIGFILFWFLRSQKQKPLDQDALQQAVKWLESTIKQTNQSMQDVIAVL
ncbi:MAG: hypothetical protein ACO3C8_01840, partial [Bacilli bacterium]